MFHDKSEVIKTEEEKTEKKHSLETEPFISNAFFQTLGAWQYKLRASPEAFFHQESGYNI